MFTYVIGESVGARLSLCLPLYYITKTRLLHNNKPSRKKTTFRVIGAQYFQAHSGMICQGEVEENIILHYGKFKFKRCV